ncbi:MAG: superoxide dismutase [Bacteroidetes bacterium]|nr:superoxide dismutase [Bacteroidota bacterium]
MKFKILTLIIVFLFLSGLKLFSQTNAVDYSKKPAEFVYKGISFYQLPYAYNALEPFIDKETVMIHYDRHHKTYFTKYVDAMEAKPELQVKIEDVLKKISQYSDAIHNNAGGYYNHILYWQIMQPDGNNMPKGILASAIDKKFGSFENMKKQITDAALSRFGSGWVWLSVNEKHELFVSSTANQDCPLMDIVKERGTPIFALDVWEHAYYLKYQNKRKDYVDNFWKLINWTVVEKLYEEAGK